MEIADQSDIVQAVDAAYNEMGESMGFDVDVILHDEDGLSDYYFAKANSPYNIWINPGSEMTGVETRIEFNDYDDEKGRCRTSLTEFAKEISAMVTMRDDLVKRGYQLVSEPVSQRDIRLVFNVPAESPTDTKQVKGLVEVAMQYIR